MKANYTRVMRAICAHPWAITREKLDAICAVVELRATGGSASKDEIRAALGGDAPRGVRLESGGKIAVIPLHGIISHRMNLLTDFSGGTSLGVFRSQLRKMAEDSDVTAIVLDIDSPGGSIYHLDEAAADIQAARKLKRVVSVVNPMMASAALWLGAQADEVVITPSGDAGSLGVFMVHDDWSKRNEAEGLTVTYIASDISPFKTEGNPDEPLTDEAQAHLQREVDEAADRFLKAVAKGRKLKASVVAETFGQGRMLNAKQAKAAGMVDEIATLEETIQRLSAVRGRLRGVSALAAATSDPAPAADAPVSSDIVPVAGTVTVGTRIWTDVEISGGESAQGAVADAPEPTAIDTLDDEADVEALVAAGRTMLHHGRRQDDTRGAA